MKADAGPRRSTSSGSSYWSPKRPVRAKARTPLRGGGLGCVCLPDDTGGVTAAAVFRGRETKGGGGGGWVVPASGWTRGVKGPGGSSGGGRQGGGGGGQGGTFQMVVVSSMTGVRWGQNGAGVTGKAGKGWSRVLTYLPRSRVN